MKYHALAAALTSLLLSGAVDAQITYTIPVEDGNTVIISTGTNALGVPVTETLSTVWSTQPPGGAITNTALSSSSSSSSSSSRTLTSSSSSSSSSRRTTLLDDPATETDTTTPADPGVRPTTTTQRGNVGAPAETNGPPMRTTTYWYDPGDGNWIEATWTASNTEPPTEPTVTVPAGTVQDYNQYQTSVNRAVISAAVAADSRRNTTSGAGSRMVNPVEAGFTGSAGWIAMIAGVAGMGWGIVAM